MSALAEANRVLFNLTEGESELVSGYKVEYIKLPLAMVEDGLGRSEDSQVHYIAHFLVRDFVQLTERKVLFKTKTLHIFCSLPGNIQWD